MSEFRLEHLRRPELLGREIEVAVLPIGSTEPHAQHLVHGTDTFQVERFAEQVVAEANRRGAKCLLLPTTPYSCNVNLVGHCPWAMSLRPATLTAFVRDIVTSVATHGVHKFVVLNGHGGNSSVLEAAMRELHGTVSAFVAMAEWYAVASDVTDEVMETAEIGHACELETSTMLHLCPEGVDMTAAEATQIRKTIFSGRGLSFVSPWHARTRNTGIGDPTVATAEKGRRIIEAAVDRIATALVELSGAPYTELFPYLG